MEEIPEIVSETRRRGRPRLLPEALVEGMRRIEPDIKMMRGLQPTRYPARLMPEPVGNTRGSSTSRPVHPGEG
jgi:hypothetical protein